jgi:hypothetical protein
LSSACATAICLILGPIAKVSYRERKEDDGRKEGRKKKGWFSSLDYCGERKEEDVR